jgi:hypothetical protein
MAKLAKSNRKQKVVYEDASARKVTFAAQKRVGDLHPYVKKVMRAIGHGEAWVSDESKLSDFMSVVKMDRTRDERVIKNKLKNEFNLDVAVTEYVVDVAERLYQRSLN